MKGGLYLETLSKVDAVVLDKTGTLTLGTPEIVDVEVYDGAGSNDVIRIAATAERFSEHPLAKAIVNRATLARHKGVDDYRRSSAHSKPGVQRGQRPGLRRHHSPALGKVGDDRFGNDDERLGRNRASSETGRRAGPERRAPSEATITRGGRRDSGVAQTRGGIGSVQESAGKAPYKESLRSASSRFVELTAHGPQEQVNLRLSKTPFQYEHIEANPATFSDWLLNDRCWREIPNCGPPRLGEFAEARLGTYQCVKS